MNIIGLTAFEKASNIYMILWVLLHKIPMELRGTKTPDSKTGPHISKIKIAHLLGCSKIVNKLLELENS